MLKKSLAFLMCLVMLLAFAGCSGNKKPATSSKNPGGSSSENISSEEASSGNSKENITNASDKKEDTSSSVKVNTEIGDPLPDVSDNGKNFSYTIIRPRTASTEIETLAKDTRSAIKKAFGATVRMTYDVTEGSQSPYEILIGETDRAETQTAKKAMQSNRANYQLDFIIKVVNEKICIYAGNDEMLQKAVRYFNETFCSSKDGWRRLNTKTQIIYEAPIKAYNHKIAGKALSTFTFVTPKSAEYIYSKDIWSIVEHISGNQGYELPVTDVRAAASANEILIGDISRAESKSVSVSGNDWIICVKNGKLVIKGGNSLSLSAGISAFYQLLVTAENSGKALGLANGYKKTGTYKPANSDYKLTWNDEFDAAKLDNYWWLDYSNSPYGNKSSSILGGSVIQTGTEGASLSNGSLNMKAFRKDKDFYDGSISTNYTMMFRYGIMEIRAKMPAAPGGAAFWLNCANTGYGNGAEFDILENFGSTKSFAANLHKWCGGDYHTSLDSDSIYRKTKQYTFTDPFDANATLADDYHVYTLIWNDHQVMEAVDGKVFFTYEMRENDDVLRLPYYLIVGTAFGGSNYGFAWKNGDPDEINLGIDYVRIYQVNDGKSIMYRRDTGIPKNISQPDSEDGYIYH